MKINDITLKENETLLIPGGDYKSMEDALKHTWIKNKVTGEIRPTELKPLTNLSIDDTKKDHSKRHIVIFEEVGNFPEEPKLASRKATSETLKDVGGEGQFGITPPIKVNYDFRKNRNSEYSYEYRNQNGDVIRKYNKNK